MKKFVVLILGLVSVPVFAQRPVVRMNLNAYINAINKIEAKSSEALSYRDKIECEFYNLTKDSSVKLSDEAISRMRTIMGESLKRIDDSATFGDYSSALSVARDEYSFVVPQMKKIAEDDVKKQIENNSCNRSKKNDALKNCDCAISPDMAVEQLEKVRSLDPNYPVDAEAAHIYYEAAKKNGAYMQKVLEYYGKVTPAKLYDHDPSYLTEYALAAFANQKNDVSKQLALYGLSKKPRNAGYNRLALYNSVELKQYEEAKGYVDALFNKSDSVELTANDYKFAGITFSALKDYDSAITYYNKQLESATEPLQKANVMKDLSDAYKAKGNFEKSLQLYEEYLKLNPKVGINDYNGLANIYRNQAANQQGAAQVASVNKAVEIYKTMEEKYPSNADFCNFMAARTLGLIDATQAKGLAKPYYEKLAKIVEEKGVKDNSDKARLSEAYTYLGIYLYKIKDETAAAKPYFEKLLQLDPENEIAKQVLVTY